MKKGLFVVIEGLDGAGKSTQLRLLAERVLAMGRDVSSLREPTDGKWGRKIRGIANSGRESITPEDELLWFINDRAEDVANNIQPALENSKVVLMDRYIYSNMAYQGALGLSPKMIKEKNQHFPQPDIILFLDVEPVDGISRIDERQGGANVGFEKLDFQLKVYQMFKGEDFNNMKRLDGKGSIEQVAESIWHHVEPLL